MSETAREQLQTIAERAGLETFVEPTDDTGCRVSILLRDSRGGCIWRYSRKAQTAGEAIAETLRGIKGMAIGRRLGLAYDEVMESNE